jgi:hypothetical protein
VIPEAEVFVLADQAAVQVYGQIRFDGNLLGSDPRGNLESISAAACDAARTVSDRDAIVHCSTATSRPGITSGSSTSRGRSAPTKTEASAAMWRSIGIFRTPVGVSDDASWRDRFLALTGREP